ncbi:MAG: sodium/proton-translocating pyrophosphatase [Polyangiaceae bacterium]
MFQIGLISALAAAVLLLSPFWAGRQRAGTGTPPEARRVLVALERASMAALRRRATSLPVAVGLGLVLLLAARWLIGAQSSALHPRNLVLALVAIVVGASTGFGVALMTVRHVRATAYSTWNGVSIGSARGIGSAWSNAATLLLAAEAAGILSVLAIDSLLRPLLSEVGLASVGNVTAQMTAYFGIGVAVSALWLQQLGSACLGAALLGADAGFGAQTGLSEADPRNPAVLVETVARQLGEVIPAALDAFVSSCLLAILTLFALNHPTAREFFPSSPALATFPLLLRTFGLVASFFAVVSLRATDHQPVMRSLSRSHWVGMIVLASAVVGLIVWLVGLSSAYVLSASLLGLALPTTLGRLRTLAHARIRPVRGPLADTSSEDHSRRIPLTGEAVEWIAWVPLAVYGVIAVGGGYLLARADHGVAAVALLIGLALPSSLSSFHGTARIAGAILGTTRLAVKLGRVVSTDVADRCMQRLTTALEQLALRFDSVTIDSSFLSCCLVAFVIASRNVTTPAGIAASGTFGALLLVAVLTFTAIGHALVSGSVNARAQSFEVERQLRGLPREGLHVHVPEDFVPSYRSAVELLARNASRGGLITTVLTVALPLLVALAGRGTENTPGSPATLLAMYISVAAAVGLAALHLGQAAPLASSLANRHRVGRLPAGTELEANASQPGLVDFLRRSTAFSIPLLTKATTLVALAFAAMLP